MRTRRPSMRPTSTATGPTYENFQPTTEWSQDAANNNLLIHLPGFKREEISVQLDNNSGKIMVRGTRKVTEDKFFRLDQSFDVPENTIFEKISGRFENGYLTLFLPFQKPKIDQEKSTTIAETHKSDEDDMQKKLESGEKKDDIQKKSESIEEKEEKPKVVQESMEKKRHEDDIQKKPENAEEKKDETIQQETAKVKSKEKRHEDDIQKKSESTEEKKVETIQQETAKVSDAEVKKKERDSDIGMEKKEKEEEFSLKEMPKEISEMGKRAERVMEKIAKVGDEEMKKKEHDSDVVMEKKKKIEEFVLNEIPKGISEMGKRAEGVMEKISKRVEEGVKNAKGSRKRGPIWRDVGEDGLGLIDNLLEKVNRNKKVIAMAVVVLSVGFFVSHKMKTNGR